MSSTLIRERLLEESKIQKWSWFLITKNKTFF
jgi:hypothetical protein